MDGQCVLVLEMILVDISGEVEVTKTPYREPPSENCIDIEASPLLSAVQTYLDEHKWDASLYKKR